MKLSIVGVGQTFNFESKEMEDVLHVQVEDGSMLVMPTTNEAAQKLIELVMNGAPGVRIQNEGYPDGAEVFGDAGFVEDQTADPSEALDSQQLFRQIQETVVGRSKGVIAKIDDRSGVPTHTLSSAQVDEWGNPIMPRMPDDLMDEEEDDPGEQI